MTAERNHIIDSLKLLCALLVVFIHCKYPYKRELLPYTDVAVPLFFCISAISSLEQHVAGTESIASFRYLYGVHCSILQRQSYSTCSQLINYGFHLGMRSRISYFSTMWHSLFTSGIYLLTSMCW